MTIFTLQLYPIDPPESKNDDSDQSLEKRLNGLNSYNTSIFNIQKMITYLKDIIQKSNKKYKN